MAVDTPARIAVLGAGPIGLETALYARFLGYDVDVYERGRIGQSVRQWGHVRLFSPFGMNASPLGLAALKAQTPGWRPPDADALLTGHEMLEQYWLPLAASDLIEEHVHQHTEVIKVAKSVSLKGELFEQEDRGDEDFRLLLRDESGGERYAEADVVIDATGVYGQANWIGPAGLPALGERAARDHFDFGLPDFAGADRARFADRRTAVIGAGYSAATNVIALAELAKRYPATRVTWITRTAGMGDGPIRRLVADPLTERDRIASAANTLAASGAVNWLPECAVHAIRRAEDDGPWTLRIEGSHPQELVVDRVLANVGFRPQRGIYRELHIDECCATDGPIKLATKLLEQPSADCLTQCAGGPATLFTSEPNFYILGGKSYGRRSNFLLRHGIRQIRDLFTIIGDREGLDLYKTIGGVEL